MISELERRILGHLPEWVEDEAAFTGANPTAAREYDLATLTAKLAEDPGAHFAFGDEVRALGMPEVAHMLELLEDRGQVAHEDLLDGVRAWRKTRAGRDHLHDETGGIEQFPGPVKLPLHPAKLGSSAKV